MARRKLDFGEEAGGLRPGFSSSRDNGVSQKSNVGCQQPRRRRFDFDSPDDPVERLPAILGPSQVDDALSSAYEDMRREHLLETAGRLNHLERKVALMRPLNDSSAGQLPETADKIKPLVLKWLSLGHTSTFASRLSNVSQGTVLAWRRKDPKFDDDYIAALRAGVDYMIEECQRRAVQGQVEPIVQKGEIVTYLRKYSDFNLKQALQARTELFADKRNVKVGGLEGAPPIAVTPITRDMPAREAGELWRQLLEQEALDDGSAEE